MSSPSYNPSAVSCRSRCSFSSDRACPSCRLDTPRPCTFPLAFTYLLIYAFGCDNQTLFGLIPFGGGDWLSFHFALL